MSRPAGVIQLILKQLPHAFGYDADAMGDAMGGAMGDETFAQANAENTFTGLTNAFDAIEPGAANVDAGARTRWSAILHGMLLVIAVVAMPRLRNIDYRLVSIPPRQAGAGAH